MRLGGVPPVPALRVELIADLLVLHQVLLYRLEHQAKVVACPFREVCQGAPHKWLLGDPRHLRTGYCTVHQWQLVIPISLLVVYLGKGEWRGKDSFAGTPSPGPFLLDFRGDESQDVRVLMPLVSAPTSLSLPSLTVGAQLEMQQSVPHL